MDLEINELELRKSFYEVSVIVNRLNKEEYSKIPSHFLEKIELEKDNNHDWEYNEDLELYQQNFSEYTLAILAMINLEYLLPNDKSQMMECIHQFIEYINNM